MSRKKPFRKPKKSLKLSTLIWLMFFFLFMGFVGLPYLNTHRYDDNNPPPHTFLIVLGEPNRVMPHFITYADLQNKSDISGLLTEDAQFPYQNLDAEFRKRGKNTYELKLKSEIFTQTFQYKVDEANQKVVPISFRTTGWIIWMYALFYLIVATVLIAIGQWLRFWWKTSFAKN